MGAASAARSAGGHLQPAGGIMRGAAEQILAGRCAVESDDPGGAGGDEGRPTQLSGVLEPDARRAVERGAVENDGVRAAIACCEPDYVARLRLNDGRLELAALAASDIDLLQRNAGRQMDGVVRQLEHARIVAAGHDAVATRAGHNENGAGSHAMASRRREEPATRQVIRRD